jgi:glycosyltransferase 2 family protein
MRSLQGVKRLLLNRWSLQLAATTGLLAFAVGRVDVDESLRAIGNADYAWAALALAVLTGSKVLAAARWRLYLSGVGEPPLAGLTGAYVIGTMVNMLLPLRAGDFTKIEIVASRYNLPRAALSSSVFTVEAVLDALTLLVLFLISLTFLDVHLVPDVVVIALVVVVGGGFVAAVLASSFLPRQMPSWRVLQRLTPRAREILAQAWPRFLDGMLALRDRRLFAEALSLHLVEWLMRGVMYWLLANSFDLDQGPATYVVLTVLLSLATLFPVTFLNFGTFQVVVTEVLVAAGAPRAEAFAYAVASHALIHVWIVVMGIVAMVLMQVSGGVVRSLAEAEAQRRA